MWKSYAIQNVYLVAFIWEWRKSGGRWAQTYTHTQNTVIARDIIAYFRYFVLIRFFALLVLPTIPLSLSLSISHFYLRWPTVSVFIAFATKLIPRNECALSISNPLLVRCVSSSFYIPFFTICSVHYILMSTYYHCHNRNIAFKMLSYNVFVFFSPRCINFRFWFSFFSFIFVYSF